MNKYIGSNNIKNFLIYIASRFAPSSKLRKKFHNQLMSLENVAQWQKNNNQIIVIENGKEYVNDWEKLPTGLTLKITGKNNVVRLNCPIYFSNSIITLRGSNYKIEIGSDCRFKCLRFSGSSGDAPAVCTIGKRVKTMGSTYINMKGRTSLTIEDDCLFAKDVVIRTTDSHAILDKDSKEVLNRQKTPLVIGRHTWVSYGVFMCKDAVVAPNTIIGAMSLVTGKFSEEYTCIAGNPAKVIKQNVTWDYTPAEYYR